MARRKNTKPINPRYFLEETALEEKLGGYPKLRSRDAALPRGSSGKGGWLDTAYDEEDAAKKAAKKKKKKAAEKKAIDQYEKRLLPKKYWWENRPPKRGKAFATWEAERVSVARRNRKKLDDEDFQKKFNKTLRKAYKDVHEPTYQRHGGDPAEEGYVWDPKEKAWVPDPHGPGKTVRTIGGALEGSEEYLIKKTWRDCRKVGGRHDACKKAVARKVKLYRKKHPPGRVVGTKSAAAGPKRVKPGHAARSKKEKSWLGTGFTKDSTQASGLQQAMAWLKAKKNLQYADKIIKQTFNYDSDKIVNFLSAYEKRNEPTGVPGRARTPEKEMPPGGKVPGQKGAEEPPQPAPKSATPKKAAAEPVAKGAKEQPGKAAEPARAQTQAEEKPMPKRYLGMSTRYLQKRGWKWNSARGEFFKGKKDLTSAVNRYKKRKTGKVASKSTQRTTKGGRAQLDKTGSKKLDPKYMAYLKKVAAERKKEEEGAAAKAAKTKSKQGTPNIP